MKVDFIVIGQGICGTVIARTLENYSKSYFVIDNNKKITSSKIAAGIMHPMSFKRCLLSWRGQEFFNFSKVFYEENDKILSSKNFKSIKLVRILSSFEEQNNWLGRYSSGIYRKHIDNKNLFFRHIINQFGSFEVKSACHLKVKNFLQSVKDDLIEKKKILIDNVKVNQIIKKENEFIYKNISSKYLILCQGASAVEDNLLNYLPIIPNKGELIDIQSKYLPDVMLSKGIFNLPLGNSKFTLGSTYNHIDRSEKVTFKAKEKILNQLYKISKNNYFKVIDQRYSFRPTTIDRKPIIGQHPQIKNLYIFNGMGSKAVLMAPLLAKELIENILNFKTLNEKIRISRFKI